MDFRRKNTSSTCFSSSLSFSPNHVSSPREPTMNVPWKFTDFFDQSVMDLVKLGLQQPQEKQGESIDLTTIIASLKDLPANMNPAQLKLKPPGRGRPALLANWTAAVMGGRFCAVCGQSCTNTHYGVEACKACSIFFRRTMLRGRVYSCKKLRRGNAAFCRISIRDLNTCYACRFDRCLLSGMDVWAVQFPEGFDASQLETILESVMQRQKLRSEILKETSSTNEDITLITSPTGTLCSTTPSSPEETIITINDEGNNSSSASSSPNSGFCQQWEEEPCGSKSFQKTHMETFLKCSSASTPQQNHFVPLVSLPLSELYRATEARILAVNYQ